MRVFSSTALIPGSCVHRASISAALSSLFLSERSFSPQSPGHGEGSGSCRFHLTVKPTLRSSITPEMLQSEDNSAEFQAPPITTAMSSRR